MPFYLTEITVILVYYYKKSFIEYLGPSVFGHTS